MIMSRCSEPTSSVGFWTHGSFLLTRISILQYEQEEIKRRENQQKVPEFVRVKDNLRRTQTFEQ